MSFFENFQYIYRLVPTKLLKMKFRLLSILLICTFFTYANDFYWIGDSGNWENPEHWSFSTNGPSCGQVPSGSDDVYFDNNSFSSEFPNITFENPTVSTFNISSIKTVSFTGDKLTVQNDFNMSSHSEFFGSIEFNSSDSDVHFINTGGYSQNANLIISQGNWELSNHLITSSGHSININCTSFNSNEFSIYGKSLTSSNTNLSLENSSIVTFDILNLTQSTKIGGDPILFSNGTSNLLTGDFCHLFY